LSNSTICYKEATPEENVPIMLIHANLIKKRSLVLGWSSNRSLLHSAVAERKLYKNCFSFTLSFCRSMCNHETYRIFK